MKGRTGRRFTVWTAQGTGSYQTYTHAMSAARWAAATSSGPVNVVSDATGQRWRVLPAT